MRKPTADEIKRANRAVYNRMNVENYNRNESIFNPSREAECRRILSEASVRSGRESFLDLATGTGNMLRIAGDYFSEMYAVDIGDSLLKSVKPVFPSCFFVAADAELLPFRDESFSCVSCYALLHHLFTHDALFAEAYRVLKSGGTLYTDHDPNRFLHRFYHPFYRLRHLVKPGFGTFEEEIAEYHNTMSSGINPEILRQKLLGIGFREVKIRYWITDRENWSFPLGFIIGMLKAFSSVCPARSLFTHFALIAVK